MNINRTKTALSSKAVALASVVLMTAGVLSLTGCVVAGVSSGGGFFIWPGSIGLILLVIIIGFVLRRR